MEKIRNYCNECVKETSHEIIHEYNQSGSPHYQCRFIYYIVKCLGCEYISFRYEFHDYENGYPEYNYETGEDEWDFPKKVENYPKELQHHRTFEDISYLPVGVKKIYNQSLLAIRENANLLAAIGLRATVEAICNDRKITGRVLEDRIEKLFKKGLISENDKNIIHSIRFLGNDSAHDIKEPKPEAIKTALEIIEHLLRTIYVNGEKTREHLDYIITEYKEFKSLLQVKIKATQKDIELPIQKIFGKEIRRVSKNLKGFESLLIKEIQSEKFKVLKLGRFDKYANSKESMQLYIKI